METDSFETDLRQALSRRAAEVPYEAIERLRHRRYQPRTAGRAAAASAGLAGVVAVAAAVAVSVAHLGSHPASTQGGHQIQAQLAAWTVSRHADGTVDVAIREVNDPARLQAKLGADGVPASVSATGNQACEAYPANATTFGHVFKFQPGQPVHGATLVIHPSALPSGAGVEISGQEASSVAFRLIRVSRGCTGN